MFNRLINNWATLVDLPQDNFITEITCTHRKITEMGLNSSSAKLLPKSSILVSSRATIGRIAISKVEVATNQGFKNIVIKNFERVDAKYVAFAITQLVDEMVRQASGGTFKEISKANFSRLKIPLPPLDVQKVIVAEIDGYQKIIEGARQVVDNYKPTIKIDSDWEMVELGEVATLINGRAYKRDELLDSGKTPVLRVGNFFSNRGWYYSDLDLPEEKYCDKGDLLYAWSASFGSRIWGGPRAIYHYHIWKVEVNEMIEKKYLYYLLEWDTENIKAEG